ncbi:hypothetical protein BU25DRAFT_460299 [Macroventuria anomochaeta]|uniref:Uncharacterized protein n=1 Tax=Macroventuria anomochaeta TaxID=301207 RepID=A0ACB6RU34_9PLEO|nr:uncharacterized protein BU25DRAFT_460299 [Macroventuria anomochaeta]KAF2625581.1 hypothetical protein BU25DRAFT_460299 [Macroventuria anomochaeta]
MHICTIPYADVAANYEEVKNLRDTSHPTSRSQRFIPHTTHRLDILPAVPESSTFTHDQNMRESNVGQISIFWYEDLTRCYAAWVATNRFPPDLVTETVKAWQSTRRGKALPPLLNGEKKWFIRLSQMSSKDSPVGGKEPPTSLPRSAAVCAPGIVCKTKSKTQRPRKER